MAYDVREFNPPLKKELPLFHYDVALYCSCFCHEINNVWPEYLSDFQKRVVSYARQVKLLCPKTQEIAKDIRIYIFDHRLNLLFAALDETGKTASYISKFCAQYKKHDCERHCYGDGSKIGDAQPCKTNGDFAYVFNWEEMRNFNQNYGFVPIETFAQPTELIFQGDRLEEYRLITTEKCIMLMEKFHVKNLVDWKLINRDVHMINVTF